MTSWDLSSSNGFLQICFHVGTQLAIILVMVCSSSPQFRGLFLQRSPSPAQLCTSVSEYQLTLLNYIFLFPFVSSNDSISSKQWCPPSDLYLLILKMIHHGFGPCKFPKSCRMVPLPLNEAALLRDPCEVCRFLRRTSNDRSSHTDRQAILPSGFVMSSV